MILVSLIDGGAIGEWQVVWAKADAECILRWSG